MRLAALRATSRGGLLGLAALLAAAPAFAVSRDPAPPWDGALCDAAIAQTERATRLPPTLLRAVGIVETGRMQPRTLRVTPWPWSVNIGGEGHIFATKAEAIGAVRALQETGTQSIDVGCMQINLMYHKTAFASLDEAFDPQANVVYAARFLGQLHGQSGDWRAAAGAYHSQTPNLGAAYADRVIAQWPRANDYVSTVPSPGAAPPPSALDRFAHNYTPQFKARLARAASDRARLTGSAAAPSKIQRAARPGVRVAVLRRGRDS